MLLFFHQLKISTNKSWKNYIEYYMKPVRAGSMFFSKVLIEHSHDCPPHPFPHPALVSIPSYAVNPFTLTTATNTTLHIPRDRRRYFTGRRSDADIICIRLLERMLNLKRIQPAEYWSARPGLLVTVLQIAYLVLSNLFDVGNSAFHVRFHFRLVSVRENSRRK